jgi:hypothetical protein
VHSFSEPATHSGNLRQIETALALRAKAGAAPGDELKRWGNVTAEYEIVR